MHGNLRGSSLLVVLLVGCELNASTGDEVGDTSAGESETSESGTTESGTTESGTETSTASASETAASETTISETSESETTEGDPDPFELIPANADWFASTQVIAHRRLGDDEQLLLGGLTLIDEVLLDEAGVLAIDLDGATRWKAIEPWAFRMHAVDALEPLANGGTWLTGATFDDGTLGDGPGWIWIGALDFAGNWMWLIDTPYGNLPSSTAVRSDGSAAILHWVFAGYGMHDFTATGEHAWSLDAWGTPNQFAAELVAVPDGVVAGGYEVVSDVFRPSEQWAWFRRVSDAGEPLDEVVHPGPAGAHDHVGMMRFDDAALTVEVLVQRFTDADQFEALWLTLDVDDLSLLDTRELGPGSPRRLELDGRGGAWIVIVDGDATSLHHFDAAGSPTWTSSISQARGLAFDLQGARAYVLRQDDTGIDVVEL